MSQSLTLKNQRDEQKDSERTWDRHCTKVKFNLNLNF